MSIVRYQAPGFVGLAAATSANGSARNGAALSMNQVSPGSLAIECLVTIVTGSVVATFNVQVSMDGTTWFDLKATNNASNVTVSATGNVALQVSDAASAYTYLRCVATLSGASTAAGDTTAVNYRYLKAGARKYF